MPLPNLAQSGLEQLEQGLEREKGQMEEKPVALPLPSLALSAREARVQSQVPGLEQATAQPQAWLAQTLRALQRPNWDQGGPQQGRGQVQAQTRSEEPVALQLPSLGPLLTAGQVQQLVQAQAQAQVKAQAQVSRQR